MKSNISNIYIYSIIYAILFISIHASILGMPYKQRPAYHDHTYSKLETSYYQQNEQKIKQEEEQMARQVELNTFVEKLLRNKESEKEKVKHHVHGNLAYINNEEEKSATIIFEIPDRWQVYALSDKEKAQLQELFKIYSIELQEQYIIINFRYKDATILPQTEDQAIYLLYSSHVKDGQIKPFNYLNEPSLDQLQKKISHLKITKKIRKKGLIDTNPFTIVLDSALT